MKQKRIYIQAAEQISIQAPLSEQWMEEPVCYQEASLVKALNPSFRDYMAANEARRMGNIMKRALVTSLKVISETGIEHPDAIITGTCLGSLDYTERFLDSMVENNEQTMSPTYFMQSTHNTVGSAIAIYTKAHGYNTTYSHGGTSFDHTLLDAWMQMQLGKISTALVGGHDEMTDSFFDLLQKVGYVGIDGMVPCGEVAMSMMLNTQADIENLCELAGVRISFRPSREKLEQQLDDMLDKAGMTRADISAVMTGVNGQPENDQRYRDMAETLFPEKPLLHYKHVFGENYTVSGLGVYACAHLLKQHTIPSFLYDSEQHVDTLKSILMLNLTKEGDVTMILLKKT